jgi:hypothetical protein
VDVAVADAAVANIDFDFVGAERTEFESVGFEALALGMGRVGVYRHVFVQKENCEYAFVGRRPLDNSSSMEGMDSNIGNAMNGH